MILEQKTRRALILVSAIAAAVMIGRNLFMSSQTQIVVTPSKEAGYIELDSLDEAATEQTLIQAKLGSVFALNKETECENGRWIGSDTSGFLLCTVAIKGVENPVVVIRASVEGPMNYSEAEPLLAERVRYVEVAWSSHPQETPSVIPEDERLAILTAVENELGGKLHDRLVLRAVQFAAAQ